MRQFDVENIEGSIDLRGTKLLIHIYGSGGIGAKLRENDWLRTNFVALPIMGVHAGYLAAACRVYREATEELKTATRVVVTGHSMGGAIAEVLGTLIAWFRKIPAEAHNFGGPAPWSRIFLARLAGVGVDHHWHVAWWDIAPFAMFWNRHLGRPHFFNSGLRLKDIHRKGYNELIKERL